MTASKIDQWTRALIGDSVDPVEAGKILQQMATAQTGELPRLIATMAEDTERVANSDPAILGALALAVQRLAVGETGTPEFGAEDDEAERAAKLQASLQQAYGEIDPTDIEKVVLAYPPQAANRFRLMYPLGLIRTSESLAVLARLLAERPPQSWVEVGQLLSPLLRHDDWQPSDLFPAALDALVHRSVAAPLLDLANFLTRSGRVVSHPAAERQQALETLLGAVADRLGKFEEDPRTFGDSVDQVQEVLGEAVAVAVSLCDALGLIGQESATAKLYKAMDLRHRRVQCEAAGALARLGVEAGKQRLLELAAEPVARLRVLAYAEELGIGSEVDDIYRSDVAQAEAELALWLSRPEQMGVPPTLVEVIDSRLQYWPSFDRPVDCFLVRFEYQFGDRAYSNIGITGPMVHVVAADLADLPLDDIYSVYAGWQVDHPDIFQVAANQWNAAQRRLSTPLEERLDQLGFEAIKPIALGFFLDEHALIAQAEREGTACVVVTDGLETIDFATPGRLRPLQGDDVWHLYLGRKMLRTFNQ